jgi:hypothetical protein
MRHPRPFSAPAERARGGPRGERTDAIESRRRARTRALGVALGLPLLLAAAALLLAGAFPLRLDLRTFQAQARLEPLGLPRGADFLVLTRDNAIASAELANFALAHWSFPRGARHWLTLAETSTDVWSGGFLGVDARGAFQRPVARTRGWVFAPAERPAWLVSAPGRAALVYDAPATRAAFEQRLPELRTAPRVFVAGDGRPAGVPLGRPRLLVTLTRLSRLAALLGTLVAAVALMRRAVGSAAPPTLATAVGVTAGLAALVAAVYVAGALRPGLGGAAPFALWAAGLVATWRLAPAAAPAPGAALGRPWRVALLAAVSLYAAVVVLRLDFDGDTYTTYIPAARYMHLLGHHDPRDPGVGALVQGAVYPPGFPALLALPLWVMDQPRETSFALGPETAAVVLLYRLASVTLDVAFLAALAAFLAGLPRGTPHLALAGALGALAVAPVLRGAHTAAETLLVPLAGTALVALSAGRRAGLPALSAAGLFLGGLLTLVKLDGGPCLALLVLPVWLALPDARGRHVAAWRREGPLAAALLLGLVPFVVWRLSGPAANPAFAGAGAADALARLPGLAAEAFKLLVKHELWLPLLVLLPAAVAVRLARRSAPRELLPPLGVATQCALWVGVYAFSTLGALGHMQVSLPRIMLAPALAALVYALETCGHDAAGSPA